MLTSKGDPCSLPFFITSSLRFRKKELKIQLNEQWKEERTLLENAARSQEEKISDLTQQHGRKMEEFTRQLQEIQVH